MFALLFALALSKPQFVNILPYPVEITINEGVWELKSTDKIQYDSNSDEMKDVATVCAEFLRKVTGFELPLVTSAISSGIVFKQISLDQAESYKLSVTSEKVVISANDRDGYFYGYQSLLQLLPIAVFSDSVQLTRWIAQNVEIYDYPRFQWRGVMVDTSRHFNTVESLKSVVDAMAMNKLNILHLHLNDDQGWRLEIKKYPKLIEVGSVRKQSPVKWNRDTLDGTQYGPYYYTQEEMRDLVAYAKKRSVKIVAEIEMPGHTLAGLAAYPEYSCTGGPFEPWCYWGVSGDVFCAGNDATFDFLKDILLEVFDIFDQTVYIHCGGDECPKGRWQNCPKCQARMKELGLTDWNSLETWFLEYMSKWIMSQGKRLIGWDEMMEGGLPEGSIVMSWRSTSAGQEAARAGHDVVMADWGSLYLDRWQFPSDLDPYEYNNYICTTRLIWGYDPRQGLDSEAQKHVLGVQTSQWAEYVWGMDDLQYKTFPRSCATAEIGWLPLDKKDWNRFVKIVTECQIPRLQKIGFNAAPLAIHPNAEWLKNEIPEQWTTVQWPITGAINQKGRYEIIFVHNGGPSSLKIRNVKLIFNEAVVASDDHEGKAGEIPENNIYSINQQTDPISGMKVYISAEVKSEDGTDSHGHVYLYHL
ncbi:Beta-hexosaminidase [Tritrichomonas foetus]|uniref:beta-N-acetylhexosaminidase n=1 Tax=Tritrichomonas foetus TaxID=1144522 RepID=A0A1J4K109_9EUKA|nr:Beta-hexosaminidase [Tritrichomonas foetus]|eukprot:OHT03438.1 Beta-hexosaminidase [Tritrichomonas foetus]